MTKRNIAISALGALAFTASAAVATLYLSGLDMDGLLYGVSMADLLLVFALVSYIGYHAITGEKM